MASINITTLTAGFAAITISTPAPTSPQYIRSELTNEGISLALVDEVDRIERFSLSELDAIVDAVSAFRVTSGDPMLEVLFDIVVESVVSVESWAMDTSPDFSAEETCEPMDETDDEEVVESGVMDLGEEALEVVMLADGMEYRESREV